MSNEEFATCTAILESATGKPFKKHDLTIWFDLLKDLPGEAVLASCRRFAMDGDGWPTVAKIRRLASEQAHGTLESHGEVWQDVLKYVRSYGIYQKSEARDRLSEMAWRALGGDIGWEWLCDMEPGDRTAAAAQFRQRYQELSAQETRRRNLPESVRPKVNYEEHREAVPEARRLVQHTANGFGGVE